VGDLAAFLAIIQLCAFPAPCSSADAKNNSVADDPRSGRALADDGGPGTPAWRLVAECIATTACKAQLLSDENKPQPH